MVRDFEARGPVLQPRGLSNPSPCPTPPLPSARCTTLGLRDGPASLKNLGLKLVIRQGLALSHRTPPINPPHLAPIPASPTPCVKHKHSAPGPRPPARAPPPGRPPRCCGAPSAPKRPTSTALVGAAVALSGAGPQCSGALQRGRVLPCLQELAPASGEAVGTECAVSNRSPLLTRVLAGIVLWEICSGEAPERGRLRDLGWVGSRGLLRLLGLLSMLHSRRCQGAYPFC